MNQVINYIFKFIIPIFYLIFILSGVACAFISGLIEYLVVDNLLASSGIELFTSISIPFLIVFAFESSKLFLVFYKEATDNVNNYKMFSIMRIGLIIFSVFCTLLFTFDKLNQPRVGEEIERQKLVLEADYQRKTTIIGEEIQSQKNIQAKERITGIGERYEEAQRQIDILNERKIALAVQHANKINTVETNTTSTNRTDNEFLSSALSIFTRAITGNDNYSPRWYIILVILLSFLLSAGLEIVIFVSFRILAQTNPKSLDFANHTSSNPNELILLSLLPGLSIFLGYIFFVKTFNDILAIGTVTFVVTTLSVLLVRTLKSPDFIVRKTQDFKPRKLILDSIVYPSIVGGVVATALAVICISLYGLGLNAISLYGIALAIFLGIVGKVSSDALARQKIVELDKISEELEKERAKIDALNPYANS